MRILPIILSMLVHVSVIAAVILGGGIGGSTPIDISQQVYSVDIVGTPGLPLGPEGEPDKAAEAEPEGGPAKPAPKEVAATPTPEIKPEPQPAPAAKPVEKGKAISAQKKDLPEKPEAKPEPPKPEKKVAEKKPEPPKPEPKVEQKPEPEKKEPPKKTVAEKPQPKQPSSRDVIASALSAVKKEAADQAAADRTELERELEALRGSMGGQGQGSGTGRGRSGGSGGGGGADPLTAYGNYVKNLIKQYWALPPIIDRSMNYAAVVRVTVDRRGNIQQFYVQASSGRQDFDLSTIKAIKMAQQNAMLEPPPVNGDIALNITFNSQEM